jgi:hypothetical protein
VFSCDDVSSSKEKTHSSNLANHGNAIDLAQALGSGYSDAFSKLEQMDKSGDVESKEKRTLRGDTKGLFERIDIGNAITTFSQFFQKYVISPIINTFNYITG